MGSVFTETATWSYTSYLEGMLKERAVRRRKGTWAAGGWRTPEIPALPPYRSRLLSVIYESWPSSNCLAKADMVVQSCNRLQMGSM